MIRWRIWKLLKYLPAFALLGYVIYANWDPPSGSGLKDVWQVHVIERKPIDGVSLLAAFLFFGISLLVTLYRWHVLVRALDLPITLTATLRIGLLGFFFNTFLPGSVGGDLVKAAAVAREQTRRTAAVATVIMDRVTGLWSLISFVALVGGISWLFGLLDGDEAHPSFVIISVAAGFVGITLIGWILIGLAPKSGMERLVRKSASLPKIGGIVAELWRVIWMYRGRPASVAAAVGLSWLSNIGFVLGFYCSTLTLWNGLANNPLPTLTQFFLILPLGSMIGAIPLFPGGAGISEAGFGGLFVLFGSAATNGILASLVNRFVSWIIGVMSYVVCLCLRADQRNSFIRMEPSSGALNPATSEKPMVVKDGLSP